MTFNCFWAIKNEGDNMYRVVPMAKTTLNVPPADHTNVASPTANSKDDIRNVRPHKRPDREPARRPTTKTTFESKTTLKQINKDDQPERGKGETVVVMFVITVVSSLIRKYFSVCLFLW